MSRKTPVFINLLAIARYDHMPDYPIQFMTVGNLSYKNPNEILLEYQESQQDEETGEIMKADISLSLREGRITMERKGDFSSTMVFKKGQRYEGIYRTPYGNMDMAVYTRQLNCALSEREGTMHLKYQLNLQGTYASTNELHLEYKAGSDRAETEKGNRQ